ncbi:MAG: hypothetical protein Q7S40_03165 [Opitutaceae bacterium]|nr:hypothetical protein [Opitutaceae bacterium]
MKSPLRSAGLTSMLRTALRRSRVGCAGLACVAGAFAADKPPAIKVTKTPATATSGAVVKIEGIFGTRYTAHADVADNTTFDLTGMAWTPKPTHPVVTAFSVGEQSKPPTNITILGGTVNGSIPLEWSWELTHAFGGAGFYTVGAGLHRLEGARIHNMHDGWRPRETPLFRARSYPNSGKFLMRACYLTGIRDDAIENDEFMPGDIEDCLIDGTWTFLSEQNETVNGVRYLKVPAIGPNEDPEIRVTRTLVRLARTNGDPGLGTWFKFHGYETPNHKIVITDSVFAAGEQPRNGWKLLNFHQNATFKGTNYLLWLGEPGKYGATKPKGVTFLEGGAAKAKWHALRNEWLMAHGYEPVSADDWNPMKAAVAAPKRR